MSNNNQTVYVPRILWYATTELIKYSRALVVVRCLEWTGGGGDDDVSPDCDPAAAVMVR